MKFYTCGEIGQMSWELLRNKLVAKRNTNSVEAMGSPMKKKR